MLARLAMTALAALSATPALAKLQSMRATIPGSLHQCEQTNLFFFDTSNTRPLSVLFLPSSQVPDSLRSGTTTVSEAEKYSPVLALEGIETPDAQQYDFELQIKEGEVVELFGFLPDGSGKALSLTRAITTPLPGATNCLNNVPTSIAGAGSVTTAVSASQPSASSGAGSSSSSTSKASSSSSSAPSSGSSASSAYSSSPSAPSSAPSPSSAAVKGHAVDPAILAGWSAAVAGVVFVASGLLS
ncbi:hypothetical protein NBRC10512_003590 [Rhodotorula toruloides]|uniref:RHTO0S03e09604g1_1 n=2 Tax=Rhodotorula toruloides TaxID=5286 RepID=A0A061AMT6_RHOTO|nr:uncharacterized protein RHTO_00458 [Rhodotorula toruloides NP11]EMS26030.1 hypothetical protein RHTO_00458 [Rhodotorula toruloides NP11]CDR38446.1 RHTO0S03e09604g1_1 [Rhodotorula toruloides]